MIGYCHFELEHHQQALQMCRKVAETTFPVAEDGRHSQRGQQMGSGLHHGPDLSQSLGKAADAIAEYARVEERFADAAEAIKFFSRKEIALDEVTTIKPDDAKKVTLRFRNIPEAAIKVYRIDLMKFGLMQRNLDRITAINLAGIKPYHEATSRSWVTAKTIVIAKKNYRCRWRKKVRTCWFVGAKTITLPVWSWSAR